MQQVEHTQLAISCVKCIQYWNSGSLVSSEMWNGENVHILPPCITLENFSWVHANYLYSNLNFCCLLAYTTLCQKADVLLWTKVPLFLCTVDVGYFRHSNLFLMWCCGKSNWHPVTNEIISTVEVSTKTWWQNTNSHVANVGFVFNLIMQCLFSACCCLSHLITIYFQEAFNISYQQPLTCDNIHEQCCTKNSFSRLSMQTNLRPHLVCG